jgi:hypothetical protein
MKNAAVLGVFLSLLPIATVTHAAHADDDKAACLEAASQGQRLRGAHKLFEAREQLRVCARAQCPAVVQSDCAAWLDSVEKALPSVVLAAKSGAGADLIDVKVTADGQPFATKMDGQAVPIDPGPHTFHFEAADGTAVDQQVVVREGLQSQPVSVVIGAPPAAPPPAASTVEPRPAAEQPRGSSPWRTVGWVLGGAGVVGLGVGVVGGVIAAGDKNDMHCSSNNVCTDKGPLQSAFGAATAADVGFVAGGILLAAGVVLVVWAPGEGHGSSTGRGVRVAPVVSANQTGLAVGGAW